MARKNDHYSGVQLEDIDHKISLVLEATLPLKDMPADIKEIKNRLGVVESDVKVIKTVVKDHSTILSDHEYRIASIELGNQNK